MVGIVPPSMMCSAPVIAEARSAKIAATFTLADAATWSPDTSFDVVFSNATYQWLSNHRALLPRLMGFTKPDGVFAFQVPCNFNAPSHVLMRETAGEIDELAVPPMQQTRGETIRTLVRGGIRRFRIRFDGRRRAEARCRAQEPDRQQ